MKAASVLWIVFVLAGITVGSSAAATPNVDPAVTSATTVGYWQTKDRHGSYRVVIWNEGYEHVSSGVTAEWIAEPGSPNDDSQILFSKLIVEPNAFSFGEPTFVQLRKGRVRVKLTGVNSFEPTLKISCSFDLSPGGSVSVVMPCD
jgi:hypothetical protein